MTATTSNNDPASEQHEATGFMSGVINDVKRRLNPKTYCSDWSDGLHFQVLNAAFFMFFASITPALAFAGTLSEATHSEMGVIELIMSTAICGVMGAVLHGQPLLIVGVTGPTIILYGAMYGVATSAGIPFIPFMGWVCVWAAIMFVFLGLFGAAALAKTVTRFTDELFGSFIGVVYLSVAITGFATQFTHTETTGLSNALLSLLLALGTGSLCLALHYARDWTTLTPTVRDLLARYNTFLAVLIFTGFSFWGVLQDANIDRMTQFIQPGMWNGQPTPNATGKSRGWIVDLGAVPVQYIFLAIVPAIVLVLLVFFDNSVVGLLTQAPQFRLKKGTAFHWDTIVLALMTLVCGLLGLPPVNGVLPQSPLHVQALVMTFVKKMNGATNALDETASSSETSTGTSTSSRVLENRLSPLLQSVLCGLVLVIFPIVREIPMAVLWGLFLYLGVAGFIGNQFAERVASLLVFQKDSMPVEGEDGYKGYINGVPFGVMVGFTALQVVCLGVIYYVGEHGPSPIIKCIFAILVVLLIPLRSFIMPLIFKEEHLVILDGHGDIDSDDHDHDIESGSDGDVSQDDGSDDDAMQSISRLSAYPSRGSILTLVQRRHRQRRNTCTNSARHTMPAAVSPASTGNATSAMSFIKSHETMVNRMQRREGSHLIAGA